MHKNKWKISQLSNEELIDKAINVDGFKSRKTAAVIFLSSLLAGICLSFIPTIGVFSLPVMSALGLVVATPKALFDSIKERKLLNEIEKRGILNEYYKKQNEYNDFIVNDKTQEKNKKQIVKAIDKSETKKENYTWRKSYLLDDIQKNMDLNEEIEKGN